MYTGVDRRVFTRVDCKLTVRYSTEGAGQEFCTATENISGSGVRIALLKKMPPGGILDLEIFKNDSNSSVRCRGEVMWISIPDMKAGIRFINIDLMYVGTLIKDFLIQNAAIPSLN